MGSPPQPEFPYPSHIDNMGLTFKANFTQSNRANYYYVQNEGPPLVKGVEER